MGEYRNLNKPIKIDSIDPQNMVLEDGSEWQFFLIKPPLSWQKGDQVVIEKRETKMKSETKYAVINNTREGQDRSILSLRGSISKKQIIEINKSLRDSKEYPPERLGWNLRIEKLLEDARIQLEDGSVWQLSSQTNKDEGEWEERQVVCIFKGSSGLDIYYMENLKINRNPFIVKFLGFQQ